MEAKAILSQFGLVHSTLAQIWLVQFADNVLCRESSTVVYISDWYMHSLRMAVLCL